MAQRRGSFHRASGSKRPVSWGNGPGGTALQLINSSVSILLNAGVQITTPAEMTLMRLRGRMSVHLLTATSVGDGFQGAFGIGKVQAAAFDAGVASVPTPITEAAADIWIYHTFFGVHANATSAPFGDLSTFEIEVDSKAMRKWDDGEVIFAAIEVVEIGAATANMFFDSRVLVKN